MLMILFMNSGLILLLIMLSKFLKTKGQKNREKMSPFECGFDPQHKNRNTFSIRFFMITILFLIFDVELSIMLPIPLSFAWSSSWMIASNFIIFSLLSVGLIMEWSQKALNWQ